MGLCAAHKLSKSKSLARLKHSEVRRFFVLSVGLTAPNEDNGINYHISTYEKDYDRSARVPI